MFHIYNILYVIRECFEYFLEENMAWNKEV